MTRGPLGGPRPFAHEKCNVVLVAIVDHGGRGRPDDAHMLEDMVADASKSVLPEDRRGVLSYGDGRLSVAVAPFNSITPDGLGSVEEEILDKARGVFNMDNLIVRVEAGDAQRIIEEYM